MNIFILKIYFRQNQESAHKTGCVPVHQRLGHPHSQNSLISLTTKNNDD